MYNLFLGLHNIWRWVVLVTAIYALVRAYSGWLGKRPWSGTDRKAGMFYGITMDIQLLLGLLLYFVFSPLTRSALSNLSAAMGSRELAFFVVEHGLVMLVAVALVHMGTTISRREITDIARHRTAAIWFTIATLVVVLAIPWWRPLLRI